MITVSKISTQRVEEGEVILRGRTRNDIHQMLYFVINGNSKMQPILTGKRGFMTMSKDPLELAREMIHIQHLYNKTNGMRIRGFIVSIPAQDLNTGKEISELREIGNSISGYFFYLGYQNVYGIFERGSSVYEIWYIVNTVSYVEGVKLKANEYERLDELRACAQYVVQRVTGRLTCCEMFDFTSLEYYPYAR